jgi:hypothetical protein
VGAGALPGAGRRARARTRIIGGSSELTLHHIRDAAVDGGLLRLGDLAGALRGRLLLRLLLLLRRLGGGVVLLAAAEGGHPVCERGLFGGRLGLLFPLLLLALELLLERVQLGLELAAARDRVAVLVNLRLALRRLGGRAVVVIVRRLIVRHFSNQEINGAGRSAARVLTRPSDKV